MNTKSLRILVVLAVTATIVVLANGCAAHIGYVAPDSSLTFSGPGDLDEVARATEAARRYQADQIRAQQGQVASQMCEDLKQAYLNGQVASVLCQSNGQTICMPAEQPACQVYGYGGYGVPQYGTPLLRSAAADAEADAVRRQLVRAAQALDGQQAVIVGQSLEIRALEEDMEVILESE
jgi:hypothetical protein